MTDIATIAVIDRFCSLYFVNFRLLIIEIQFYCTFNYLSSNLSLIPIKKLINKVMRYVRFCLVVVCLSTSKWKVGNIFLARDTDESNPRTISTTVYEYQLTYSQYYCVITLR